MKATDDGALIFTRRDGTRIPDVPRPLALAGHPLEVLQQAHRKLGVSAETHRCHWDGVRPDYGLAIQVLDQFVRRRTGEDDGEGDAAAA